MGPTDSAAPVVALTPETFRLQGAVELQNIAFGYRQVSPSLIEHVSLNLTPGQRVALVDTSAAGKSTVTKLVCGLYET